MHLLILATLSLIGTHVHAQTQCEKTYVDRCQRVSNAAGAFSPTLTTDGGGARAIQQAQQQAFSQTGDAWQSALKTCVGERKACVQACAETADACKEKIDPLIQQANTQMLTNQDQARVASGQTSYTDDIVEDQARRDAASAREGEGATVQKAGWGPVMICPQEGQCYDERGNFYKDLSNGAQTVIPSGGSTSNGGYTILNPYSDAAGIRKK